MRPAVAFPSGPAAARRAASPRVEAPRPANARPASPRPASPRPRDLRAKGSNPGPFVAPIRAPRPGREARS